MNTTMKSLLYALAAFSLTACSSNAELGTPGDYITRNDFEAMMGWIPDATALTKEHAHSGEYAIQVNPNQEFSLTYTAMLGNVSPHKLRGIRLEAWVYLPDDKTTGVLGVQILDPSQGNKEIFGDGINLQETIRDYKKWVLVSKDITLPDNIAYTHNLKVFLWRAGTASTVYVDDLSLKGIE
ncbi:hypothetical protein [Hymenobacter sp. DG25A]|uniref:hypothetical protein n=1 Tax=Hymenobacter sp. DG25A TaxID=1385663 RepID=UPI0006BC9DCF|nr:hypothetical protein [Hymenobacter sp. DG25A]ALD22038.1 hypothetical protein AM218_13480 [Hymenobacter sp. DG25A]